MDGFYEELNSPINRGFMLMMDVDMEIENRCRKHVDDAV